MTVTIRDVARACGVSVTTVSRALNGYTDIGAQTRERILEVAQKLNYHPSQVARSLVMNKTRTVGLLISDFNKDRGGHHFMFDVLAGVHDSLAAAGYDVTLVSTTTAEQRTVSYLDLCTERRFEGVVVMGIRLDDPYVHEVVDAPLPSVVIDLPLLSQHCGYVMTDNVNGARFAIRHLLKQGRSNIGFVNGHAQAAVSIDRRRGYEEALKEAGIAVQPEWIYESDFTLEGGALGLETLLSRVPNLDAVFFASDMMAIGALRYAHRANLSVPGQIAIVGFDNIDMAEFITPALTTVSQPRYEMGVTAADMLLRMMQENDSPEGRMLSPQLVVRETA